MKKHLKIISLSFLILAVCCCVAQAQTKAPKTVRDFFNLLPQKYFTLEGCFPAKDKGCEKARREYIQNFLEIEDTANGYWKSGCDGAQSCLEMTLFKRLNGTYIVAVYTAAEMMNNYYFLEYRNGQWFDVSKQIVPQFSKKNMYELPHYGTTVKVFAKKIIESSSKPGEEYEVSEKGAKLYELVWKDGKFTVQR